jgi:DNA-binding NarL/FixJ family response regulator
MSQTAIRVALLDDHRILAQSLAAVLRKESDMEVVCVAHDTEAGVEQIIAAKPDLVTLDIELPGRGCFEVAAELNARLPGVKLVMLSGFLSSVFLEHALRAKAAGYLLKGEPIEEFVVALRRVHAGGHVFSRSVENLLTYDAVKNRYQLKQATPFAALTSRQLEVLRLLAKGESVKEVAKTMHLSQKSVDSHKYRIMHKLGIHDRVQLARFAFREGLVLP